MSVTARPSHASLAARMASVATVLLLAACAGDGGDGGGDGEPSDDASTPASQAPTATTTAPEPSGTTSSRPSGRARPEVTGTVATGLEVPWGIAFLPDGSAVVTERDTARVLHLTEDGDGWRTREAGTVDAAAPGAEGGLLGVAASPEFADDATLFLYVTTAEDNRIVRATFRDGSLGATEPVLTGIPRGAIHDGGRLAFGPDGHLYASTGEIGEADLAQDEGSLAGKILRITPEGDPAPGNPDPGSPVWTLGHRNVQGLAWDDRETLWASEFGASTWDELNRIEKGDNYGWPQVEGRAADNPGADAAGLTDPLAVWSTDEASPSGLAFADGSLWLGALRGTRLWQVPLTEEGVGRSVPHFVGDYGRVRTVVAAPDGTLWMTTSNRDGRGSPQDQDDRILQVTLSR